MLDFWFLPATKLPLYPLPFWPPHSALSSLLLALIRHLLSSLSVVPYLKQLEEPLLPG